jgi:hypothetical protein
MEDKKYIGVVLRMHNKAGIARINITNTTTSTAILTDKDIDLYMSEFNRDATPAQYTTWCFWWEVQPIDDNYEMSVALSPSSATGRYIEIEKYLTDNPLYDGAVTTVMETWHEDYPDDLYSYTLVQDVVTSLNVGLVFEGDGTTTVFSIPSNQHASEFIGFSLDGGTTWKNPSDLAITWGSNSPNYDDEIIDTSGHFSIKFFTPPPDVNNLNVGILFTPWTTHYHLKRTMSQPSDGGTFIDYTKEVRLLDDALELIP